MFTAARRCVSNTLASVSITNRSYGNNINPIAGCYIRKLTRTANGSSGGLKAVVTTALLFIMGALYCLYGTGGSPSRTMTTIAFSQQSMESKDLLSIELDAISVIQSINKNSSTNLTSGNSDSIGKKRWKKQQKLKAQSSSSGVLTAADMYEPGFRIHNAGLCTAHTRLLVLITSAAAPSHSQNRQAIRMTWMNRYGPSVSMAFLVGTPQMSEADPVAQLLETEERALQTRLNRINIKNDKLRENLKSKSSAYMASGMTDVLIDSQGNDLGSNKFLQDRELNSEEGLDAQAMHGLNEAERAVQRVLGREHGRYGDLIQCQSRDTYTNLTLKSIAGLEWTRQYCPSARYLLKTDDDMFLDIRRLLRFIDKIETEAIAEVDVEDISESMQMDRNKLFSMGAGVFESTATSNFGIELPPTIWGRLASGWRPIRQHNSKYYVSRAQYADRVFPDFCTGPAYLMTRSAVSPLYEGALGKDFDILDENDNQNEKEPANNNKKCNDSNQTLISGCDKVTGVGSPGKNTVPYLKLEDVYLTGVVAERLTRRAAERLARQEKIKKDRNSKSGDRNQNTFNAGKTAENRRWFDGEKTTRLKASDVIVKVRRIHDDQFANKKISGRALDRAVCSGLSPGENAGTSGSGGFSWLRWYWGDTAVEQNPKKNKKDQGVISIHMVKYFEQFDLWRRLMDGRTKCKP